MASSVLAWTCAINYHTYYHRGYNPLQHSRNTAYIIGGIAGVVALAMLLLQPLLACGALLNVHATVSRRLHRCLGSALLLAIVLHVVGLYITSPGNIRDELLLIAPTPYSIYGSIGLWVLVLTTLLVALRIRMPISSNIWKILHNTLTVIVVVASVVHALMIDGAMDSLSKWILCIVVLIAVGFVTYRLRFHKALTCALRAWKN